MAKLNIPVKNHAQLRRNKINKSIINTDNKSYSSRLSRIKALAKKEKELDSLKSEVADLKQLMQEILNNKKQNESS